MNMVLMMMMMQTCLACTCIVNLDEMPCFHPQFTVLEQRVGCKLDDVQKINRKKGHMRLLLYMF